MLFGAVDPSWFVIVAMVLIGLGAGVLGGLLGIGGGLVMIPAMLIVLGDRFGPGSMHDYKLAALVAAFVLSIPAARRHAQAEAVVFSLLRPIIGGAVLGVALGTGLASLFAAEQTAILRRVFGGFMLLVVTANVWRQRVESDPDFVPRKSCPGSARWFPYALAVGFPSGVVSGLLGVGGGVWAVPMQHFGLGLRIPNAIANSSCMIVGVAATAAAAQTVALWRMPDLSAWDGWFLAALLAPGAFVGGRLGASLTHRIHTRWLKHAFHVLLVITGIKLLLF